MNLLPKSEAKFAEKEYWDGFFKNKSSKNFEWYGEFPELCSYLHKYVKTKDDVLVVGCGNSELSSNMYDTGYRKITNIDLSAVVIKQMKQQNKERLEMTFEVMDALNMTFSDNTFSVVLDKGTLDALMPQDEDSDRKRAKGLFKEIARVLKTGGRYVIISLLQSHILLALLEECAELGWMVRICRCHEVEDKTIKELGRLHMPVFMIICTKFRKLENVSQVLELNLDTEDKPQRVSSVTDVLVAIKEVQQGVAMCNAVQRKAMKDEAELEFRRQGDKTARYTIRVVDNFGSTLRTYGALIVPHGRETEWMFGTIEGRQLLRKSSNFDRLAVINLHRDQTYPSMKEIQEELSGSVMQLAPSGVSSHIPYVTVGDGLGSREAVYSGSSQFSGDFVVEDVLVDNERFRRLIFLNNQSVIQSEARLKKISGKKGKLRWEVDKNYVTCSYHCYMAIALELIGEPSCSVLVLGLGGGGLCSLISNLFPKANTTAVDIDPDIIDVANKYFEIRESEKLHFKDADGLEYLKECKESGTRFGVILVDVDSKTPGAAMSCPPEQFVSQATLLTMASVLEPHGILALNTVCRLESTKTEVIKNLKEIFPLAARYSLEEDVNEVIYACGRKDKSPGEWIKTIHSAANKTRTDGHKKMKKNDLIDISHFLNNLQLS